MTCTLFKTASFMKDPILFSLSTAIVKEERFYHNGFFLTTLSFGGVSN